MAKYIREKSNVECTFYVSAEDVPGPRELSSVKKKLMVFDDLLLEKQITCESYYVRGRHSNVDCFYLSHNYFKLPRQAIRDLKNIYHIFDDYVGSDMTKEEFRQLCKAAWEKQHGFVIIDQSSKKTTANIAVVLTRFTYQT